MRREITPSVEWKLNHAVEALVGADDIEERSFDRRVELFVEQWEERIRTEGSGWVDSAVERRDSTGNHASDASGATSNVSVPQFEAECRSPNVEPEVASRVEAIAAAENPSVPVGRISFNDTLLAALEAWNSYATELDAGWTPADPRVTGRP